ncbi:MAG: 6-phosphogluconolactonase [Pirellulales bacterium]
MIQPTIFPDHEAMSRHAADWLCERLRQQPESLISLAAGSTPQRLYELLAEHGRQEPALVARCRFIKLDEWGGLAMDDPATCEVQLRRLLIEPLRAAERYTAFNSRPQNAPAECHRIAAWLAANGPIDVAVLGLGINGHLGFNEPAHALQPHAHVATLSNESMQHVMLTETSDQPHFGVTLGMADLLQAKEILIVANGLTKRGPMQRLLSGALTTEFPASLLHLHPQVTLLCDEAACPNR